MAAITTIVAVGALAVAGASAYVGYQSRKDAAAAYKSQAQEERKVRNEQKALNFQQQAAERRAQIREERVRRAKILQGAENGGAAGSSGEAGALSSLSTQLNVNIGLNLGRQQAANTIGGYMQNAANFGTAAMSASSSAQNADSLFNLSTSVFSAAGGVGALNGTPPPKAGK